MKHIIRNSLLLVLACSILILPAAHVFAAPGDPIETGNTGQPIDSGNTGKPIDSGNSGQPIESGKTGDNLGDPNEIDTVADVLNVIDKITNWMFTIFLAAAVIMILYAAFTYLTSGGGEEVAKAHKMILYSAVAIAVAVLAKGVVNVVKSIVTP